ncbi:DNA adenine methylase [Leucobacter celer]|uniref:DNA adenine methylase n=1 Tax=Leucobacter celer TaxID=668625 RepID=UPI00138F0BD2|nr:Dam family site-specific DNA-(adenine-N6)-methyltransferase [Leucobacter celer]
MSVAASLRSEEVESHEAHTRPGLGPVEEELIETVAPVPAKPFLSWAGSKRRLLPQILPHIPEEFGRYIEPFLGGGSLFLELAPLDALLNDACEPLIDTWRAVQRNATGVHREAVRRPLSKDDYYVARAERGGGYLQRAGRFVYLNKGAFNGLYRVNLRGEFNVPWGAPKSDFICDRANLVAVQELLNPERVQITSGDFEAAVDLAGPNDFVFVDPPYVTSHNNNGFVEYNEKIFSWDDQVRLAQAAHRAVERGATVMVTNANHEKIITLYEGFEQVVLERASTLAASSAKRGRTTEILLIGRAG